MFTALRNSFLVLLTSVIFFSCSHHEEQIPSNILPKDKMIAVLVDIHLAEASSDTRNLTLPQINVAMAKRYDELFQKHGITYEQFKTSYDYYLEHADLLSDIYTEVVNELTTRASRFNASGKMKILRDSTNRVDRAVPDSVKARK